MKTETPTESLAYTVLSAQLTTMMRKRLNLGYDLQLITVHSRASQQLKQFENLNKIMNYQILKQTPKNSQMRIFQIFIVFLPLCGLRDTTGSI